MPSPSATGAANFPLIDAGQVVTDRHRVDLVSRWHIFPGHLTPAEGPRAATMFALNMLVGTAAGSTSSEPEYANWLRDAGFTDVRRVRLPGPSGLMIGVRA